MILRIFFAILIILIYFISATHAGIFGPKSYDECITESMKGVKSDLAARAIMKSCREQFPDVDPNA